jgi:hypothetical protein
VQNGVVDFIGFSSVVGEAFDVNDCGDLFDYGLICCPADCFHYGDADGTRQDGDY